MQDSSANHLSLVPPFVSSDAHLLWKLMTKGERLVQRYENFGGEVFGHMDMDKEGATLKNGEG